jgi:hypothetical protein
MTLKRPAFVPALLAVLSLTVGQAAGAYDQPAGVYDQPAGRLSLTLAPEFQLPADRRAAPVVADAAPDHWYASGYRWKAAPPAEPDWPGLKRDTLYFMAYQAAVIGVIYALPESISQWDNKEDANFSTWRHNVSHPEWDSDVWWINYVTHPYWGAAYYIRGRERGLDRQQSLVYSAALSTLYEYWLEPFFEPVSIQDLIATPLLGAMLGEYVFAPARDRIRAKAGEPTWSDRTLLFLTDPLGVVGAWTDRVFGIESSLSVQRLGPSARTADAGLAPEQVRLVDAQRPWGVQLQVAW